MADITATVATSFATDLFGSISYPFRIRIDGDRSLAAAAGDADNEEEAELSADWLDDGGDGDEPDFEADLEELLDFTIGNYLEATNERGDRRDESEADDSEARAFVAPYAEGVDRRPGTRRAGTAAIKARMSEDAGFGENAVAFLAPRLSFSVVWVEVEISSAPTARMGNPISLENLRVGVRAKVKACIKVFGKKFCVSATSPWIRLEGRRAELYLEAVGLKVFGRGRVSDIDIVIKIKILKWEFKIKIGITGIVNGQLGKQRPLLADLSNVQLKIPGIGKTYRPSTVQVPASGSDTMIAIDGGFS